MNFNVREMEEADLEYVFEMHVHLYKYLNEKGFVFKLNTSFLKEYLTVQLGSKFSKVFVAEANNEVCGFIAVSASKLNSKFYFDKSKYVGNITELFVKEDYRKYGLGSKLLEKSKSFFSETKVGLIQVNTMAENIAGINFYRKLGFKEDYISFITSFEK